MSDYRKISLKLLRNLPVECPIFSDILLNCAIEADVSDKEKLMAELTSFAKEALKRGKKNSGAEAVEAFCFKVHCDLLESVLTNAAWSAHLGPMLDSSASSGSVGDQDGEIQKVESDIVARGATTVGDDSQAGQLRLEARVENLEIKLGQLMNDINFTKNTFTDANNKLHSMVDNLRVTVRTLCMDLNSLQSESTSRETRVSSIVKQTVAAAVSNISLNSLPQITALEQRLNTGLENLDAATSNAVEQLQQDVRLLKQEVKGQQAGSGEGPSAGGQGRGSEQVPAASVLVQGLSMPSRCGSGHEPLRVNANLEQVRATTDGRTNFRDDSVPASPAQTSRSTSSEDYKAPRQLKMCDGTSPEEFLDWLAKLERLSEASNWSNDYKCWLIVTLTEGRAAHIVDTINRVDRKDWTKLRQHLVSKIVPSQHFERLKNDLRRRTQRPDESVHDFVQDFREKARKAYANKAAGFDEADLVTMFIEALNDEGIRLEILKQYCGSLDKAIDVAENEVSLRQLAKHRIPKVTRGFEATTVEQRSGDSGQDVPQGARRPVGQRTGGEEYRTGSRSQLNDRLCYTCNQPGHMSKNCPSRHELTSSGQGVVTCFNCHGIGHRAYLCPSARRKAPPLGNSAQPPALAITNAHSVAFVGQTKHANYDLHANVYVWIGWTGLRTCTLIDNGSLCNIMRVDFLEMLQSRGERMDVKTMGITAISGLSEGPISVQGEVFTEVAIGETEKKIFTTSFLLVNELPYEVLLGAEAMKDGDLVVSVPKRLVYVTQPDQSVINVPFVSVEKSLPFACVVTCEETVFVPGEKIVYAYARVDDRANGNVGLLEFEDFGAEEKAKLSGMDAVVTVKDGRIPVPLVNLNAEDMKCKKGTKLGMLRPWTKSCAVVIGEEKKVFVDLADEAMRKMESVMENVVGKSVVLDEDQKLKLVELLKKNAGLFLEATGKLGRTAVIKHGIDTGHAAPTVQGMRRIPEAQKQIIDEEVEKMLKHKVIQPSISPYRANFVLVQKKDGSWRPCIDFRMLNAVTKKDVYPLPRIDETLDTMGKAKIFSTIDLAHGYWQVELEEDSCEKTAFATHKGLFEFTTMPFGLCNAPSTFQRLMDVILGAYRWDFCTVYLDDIIVFSSSFEEHMIHLQKVFDKLQLAGLRMKLAKCEFGKKEVPFLAHVVTPEGIKPSQEKVQSILNWPTPKNKEELASFLGFIQYYRRFIFNFSQRAAPLLDAKRPRNDFKWTDECEAAFQQLKQEAVSYPTLRYPDFSKPFIVYTDACDRGIGAVLAQQEDGKEWAVAYASRVLSDAERRYHINDKEMLAVHWAITTVFRPYIFGRPFDLVSDSSAVMALKAHKENNGRIRRWQQDMAAYTFRLFHRKGLANSNADGLSRKPAEPTAVCAEDVLQERPVSFEEFLDQDHLSQPCPSKSFCAGPKIDRTALPKLEITIANAATIICEETNEIKRQQFEQEWPSDWSMEQWKDPFCLNICRNLVFGQLPSDVTVADQVMEQSKFFIVGEDKQLYRKPNPVGEELQLVVPASKQQLILQYFHNSAFACHLGMEKTLQKIQDRYWWPFMWLHVQDFVRSCKVCQAMKKGVTNKSPLQSIPVGGLFELIAIDILQLPKTRTGHRYVVVCTEYLSKWVISQALVDSKAETIAQFLLEKVILQHGAPNAILSDQGKQFTGEVVTELCKLLSIKKILTVPYHPQTDGLVERFNRTLISMLATTVRDYQEEWDRMLPYVIFAYNTAIQSSSNQIPFEVLYGRKVQYPIDTVLRSTVPSGPWDPKVVAQRMVEARKLASESILQAQKQQKKLYDQKRKAIEFEDGQPVWLVNSRRAKGVDGKLEPHWIGPYVIVKRVSAVNYIIRALNMKAPERTVHADQLRLHYMRAEDNLEAEAQDVVKVRGALAREPEGRCDRSQLSEGNLVEPPRAAGQRSSNIDHVHTHSSIEGIEGQRQLHPHGAPTNMKELYQVRRKWIPALQMRVGDAVVLLAEGEPVKCGYLVCPKETNKKRKRIPPGVFAIKLFGSNRIWFDNLDNIKGYEDFKNSLRQRSRLEILAKQQAEAYVEKLRLEDEEYDL